MIGLSTFFTYLQMVSLYFEYCIGLPIVTVSLTFQIFYGYFPNKSFKS